MRESRAGQIELLPAMPRQRRNTMIIRWTLLFLLFVLALLTLVIVTSIQQTNFLQGIIYEQFALPAASRAAALINGNDFERLAQSLDSSDPFYDRVRRELSAFKQETQSKYVFVLAAHGQNEFRIVIDASAPPAEKKFSAPGKDEKLLARVLREKSPQAGALINSAEWGRVIFYYAPIFNASGEVAGILSCGFDARNTYLAIKRATDSKIIIAVIFILLGIISYLLLLREIFRQYRQFQELHSKAEIASEAKSNFLAKTSHEIRTPMNAIMGMTELLLRRDIPSDAYQDALNIKNAGLNLFATINDILDFSKIESGKIEIAKTTYQLSSLLNDVINIIRIRLAEKPVRFTVNVSSKLPNHLIGDVLRIRQVLLNLLSNAVKYTYAGHISLTVAGEHMVDKKFIKLHFAVSDTGIGIKQEDIKKLFMEFMQVDVEKNQGVEGTGLGLAIGRNLCRLMHGDITVDSTYGKGSVFTAVIPQEIFDMRPMAYVLDAEIKSTLVFENRAINLQSITASLQNLGVPVTPCSNPEIFFRELRKGTYAFAFNPSPLMPQTLEVIKEQQLPTVPVLLADLGTAAATLTASVLMPAYALSIANVLNGIIETQDSEKSIEHFNAPDARVLIVDDISADIAVAKGLLSMYQAAIDIASNGPDAIARVKETAYDIIFIADMMHGMDGVETAYVIRSLHSGNQLLPIIALTANAVSGMKEMFLQNGFNDSLSKPIEITGLDAIMHKWIPQVKKCKEIPVRKTAAEAMPNGLEYFPKLDDAGFAQKLDELCAMLKIKNIKEADKILLSFEEKTYGAEQKKILDTIANYVRIGEYESSIQMIDSLVVEKIVWTEKC